MLSECFIFGHPENIQNRRFSDVVTGSKKGKFAQYGLINICNEERVFQSVQLTLVGKHLSVKTRTI